MELVIKIPEEYYKAIKEIPAEQSSADMLIIRCGTPLPKGHGRLIDADAVLSDPFGDTYKDIDVAETIIEADKSESEDK